MKFRLETAATLIRGRVAAVAVVAILVGCRSQPDAIDTTLVQDAARNETAVPNQQADASHRSNRTEADNRLEEADMNAMADLAIVESTNLSSTSPVESSAGPPAGRWVRLGIDARGNAYSLDRNDLIESAGSSRRRVSVLGDHRADQSILHRYSITHLNLDCGSGTYAVASRTNFHADGRVDRRPYYGAEPESIIMENLLREACR